MRALGARVRVAVAVRPAVLPASQHEQAATNATDAAISTIDNMLLSIGAGIYEELVFRLILISLLTFVLIDVCRMRPAAGVALSVIFSSLLFGLHHYYPVGADEWHTSEFAFRTAAGAYLAAVFVLRGFGLAVGCHIVYDIVAFLQLV